MARPTKQGIDYFPVDSQFDNQINLYAIENKDIGLNILLKLWQMIYFDEGYYIYRHKDLGLLLLQWVSVDINRVNACINNAIERNIFDKCLHKRHGILTSRAIQKRYFDAAKRKKRVEVIKEFLLIDVSAYKNLVYVDINSVNVCKNATKEDVDVDVKEDVDVNVLKDVTHTPPKKPKKKKPTNPEIKIFIDYAFEDFQKRYGNKMLIAGGKDAQTVKRLLQTYSLDKLKSLWGEFNETDDPFIRNMGKTITAFSSVINSLISKNNRIPPDLEMSDADRKYYESSQRAKEKLADV